VTRLANVKNSRRRTAAILKVVISPYISRCLTSSHSNYAIRKSTRLCRAVCAVDRHAGQEQVRWNTRVYSNALSIHLARSSLYWLPPPRKFCFCICLSVCVCLSVCLQGNSNGCRRILMKFFGRLAMDLISNSWLDSCDMDNVKQEFFSSDK